MLAVFSKKQAEITFEHRSEKNQKKKGRDDPL